MTHSRVPGGPPCFSSSGSSIPVEEVALETRDLTAGIKLQLLSFPKISLTL